MKELTHEDVHKIITLAADLRAKHPPAGEKLKMSDAEPEDKTRFYDDQKPLLSCIKSLSKEGQCELTALMWLGEGSDADYSKALERAKESYNSDTPDDIVGKAGSLPEYLRSGLGKLA